MARSDFSGAKIAIFGLGRSGFAVAMAAKQLGATPLVLEEKARESISKQDLVSAAVTAGIEITFAWDGSLPRGFTSLVVNPAVDHRHPILTRLSSEGVEILSEIEFAYRISLAPIIAITGTNGKSTTTAMAYLCLRATGIDAVLCGNIFGSGYPEIPLTEAALNSTPEQVLVAEISSFQLEWVSQFRPSVSLITNITPDHLDRYDSFDHYARTKMRIWGAQQAGDFAIVRANDPVVIPPGGSLTAYRGRAQRRNPQSTEQTSLPTVLTFGATGKQTQIDEDQTMILDTTFKHINWPFIGSHNYSNAAAAMLAAYAQLRVIAETNPESKAARILKSATDALTQKLKSRRSVFESPFDPSKTPLALPLEIAHALDDFKGLEHRMEIVGSKNGVTVINNSMCTNPAAVVASVQSIKAQTHILLGGVNKDLDFLPLKNFLGSQRHHVYIFGKDREHMFEMLGQTGTLYETLEQAFKASTLQAKPGTVIMLAPGCASTDQFRDFRHRGDVFRSIAKEWLI